jgi:ABC-2 type transport system permease protein
MRTVISLYWASLKEFLRDRSAVFWTVAFPVLFIVLFGLIFSGNSSVSYNMGLVNLDTGPVGAQLASAFGHVSAFKVHTGSQVAELAALRGGQRDLVVVIPADTSAQVAAHQTASVRLYYDPSKTTDAQIEQTIVNQVFAAFNQGITQVTPPLAVQPVTVQAQTLRYVDLLVPGILAMALMQLGIFATAQPIVALREQQVLRRLGATPLPRWQLIASQILNRLTVALFQTGVIVGIGIAAFQVRMMGNPFEFVGLVLLGAFMFIALGYLVAAVSRTQAAAAGIGQAINFPMMFLSGIFFPLAVLPAFLLPVVRALPLTYLADAIRQVMINSTPDFPITIDVLVVAGWAVACMLLSIVLFRWE